MKEGKTLGRRAVVVDVAKARKMQKEGLGLRPIAAKLGDQRQYASRGAVVAPTLYHPTNQWGKSVERRWELLTKRYTPALLKGTRQVQCMRIAPQGEPWPSTTA